MESKITGGSYVLAVNNMAASSRFYIDKLGFSLLWDAGDWQCLVRDRIKIMLGECPDEIPASATGCHSYFAYFEVANIDDLYQEFSAKEIPLNPIADKRWGQREFSLATPDGHRITFGAPVI